MSAAARRRGAIASGHGQLGADGDRAANAAAMSDAVRRPGAIASGHGELGAVEDRAANAADLNKQPDNTNTRQ